MELKDENNKDVKCENNHSYCFLCLKPSHGKIPCNKLFNSSLNEYAKKNFLKNCPKCTIITEKNSGCNHITCTNCNFQWCWLCNEEYTPDHFNQGKCKGYQFFEPDDEYQIKLAFEGKIKLKESQIQGDLREFEEDEINESEINESEIHERNNNDNTQNTNSTGNNNINANDIDFHIIDSSNDSDRRTNPKPEDNPIDDLDIEKFNKGYKFLFFFVYIFLGHIFISKNIYLVYCKKNNMIIDIIINIIIIISSIPYFFCKYI